MTSREFILFPEEYGGITTDLLNGKSFEFSKLKAANDLLVLKVERYEDALQELADWAKAYPLDIFPEPDLKRAHELLQAGGMTIDAVSASAMRHLLVRVQEIVKMARKQRWLHE
jgi:hypothetical protein